MRFQTFNESLGMYPPQIRGDDCIVPQSYHVGIVAKMPVANDQNKGSRETNLQGDIYLALPNKFHHVKHSLL